MPAIHNCCSWVRGPVVSSGRGAGSVETMGSDWTGALTISSAARIAVSTSGAVMMGVMEGCGVGVVCGDGVGAGVMGLEMTPAAPPTIVPPSPPTAAALIRSRSASGESGSRPAPYCSSQVWTYSCPASMGAPTPAATPARAARPPNPVMDCTDFVPILMRPVTAPSPRRSVAVSVPAATAAAPQARRRSSPVMS